MQLILLLILFVVIGYLLAGSDFRDRVNRGSKRVTATSENWLNRGKIWWRSRFSGHVTADQFKNWVTGSGADTVPDEFGEWSVELSENQAADFVSSLEDYADGLGYNLMKLVVGGLESKPVIKQVFVEAIVVYSDAYRKAKEAQQQEAEEKTKEELSQGDEVQPAEKSASRRNRKKVAESASAA
jgi:hypothetical protein